MKNGSNGDGSIHRFVVVPFDNGDDPTAQPVRKSPPLNSQYRVDDH
jgi:hypothetical protein